MIITARLSMDPVEMIKVNHGIGEFGPIQTYIDSECVRLMRPFTPHKSGVLGSAVSGIGSGMLIQATPYARFQYYGKLMVSPTTGSPWAKKGERKVLTSIDLKYSTIAHPLAGKKWFEEMKKVHKDNILRGAQAMADRGGQ